MAKVVQGLSQGLRLDALAAPREAQRASGCALMSSKLVCKVPGARVPRMLRGKLLLRPPGIERATIVGDDFLPHDERPGDY